MSLRVDLRRSVATANGVFTRQPILFAAPLLLFGAISWAFTWLVERSGTGWFISLGTIIGTFVSLLCTYALQVCLSAMFLKARTGQEAAVNDGNKALRYPGLHGYLWELLGKYLAWGLLSVGVVLLILILGAGIGVTPHFHGIGKILRGSFFLLGFIPAMVFIAMVMSRYQFVLPIFAIVEGRHAYGLMAEAVQRAKMVWGIVLTLALIEFAPGLVDLIYHHFVTAHWSEAHRTAWRACFSVAEDLWITWFVLLKTDVAVQVLEQAPLGEALLPMTHGDPFALPHPVENSFTQNLVNLPSPTQMP